MNRWKAYSAFFIYLAAWWIKDALEADSLHSFFGRALLTTLFASAGFCIGFWVCKRLR